MPKVLILFKCHGLQNCQSNHLLTNNYHPTLHKVLKNWQQLVDIRLLYNRDIYPADHEVPA